jgi:ABC-type transporter Mla subunit MlaD
MDLKQQRFRLGLFVAGSAVLLAVLILMFGGSAGKLFVRQSAYVITFDNAPGVSKGTPVRRSGVKIGAVSKVVLDDKTGNVFVTIEVDRGHTVWKSDVAQISQDLLSRDTTIDLVKTESPGPRLAPPQPAPANPKIEIKPVGAIEVPDNILAAGQQPPAPMPGPPADEPLPPGSTIPGRPPGGPGGVAEFQRIIPPLEQALNAIRRSAERLEQAIPELDAGAREFTSLGRAIREAVPEVRRTNDEVQGLLRTARGIGPELRRTNEEMQVTLRNFGSVAERLDNFMAANQDRITRAIDQTTDVLQRMSNVLNDENQRNLASGLRNADEFLKEGTKATRQFQVTVSQTDRMMRNLDISAEQLARILANLNEALAPLSRSEGGTVQKFFTDPSLYNNLNEAACLVAKVMPRLDRILRDVEVFADKIARHPETIGIGGAVRPSAGLKEAPTSPQYRQYP